jgi:7 transmembrane receptor (rhodopsin family).
MFKLKWNDLFVLASTVFLFPGNLVTVIALLKCSKLRHHATTAFVISLAISDLLFCSINLPLTASRYINQAWVLGSELCKLFPFFFYGNVAVSLLSMVAITVNRYSSQRQTCYTNICSTK